MNVCQTNSPLLHDPNKFADSAIDESVPIVKRDDLRELRDRFAEQHCSTE